jgi:hypothetical protein
LATFGLADARDEAKDILRRAANGDDPQAQKKADRLGDTVSELAEAFVERCSKPHKKTWRKDKQMIDRDLLAQDRQQEGGRCQARHIRSVRPFSGRRTAHAVKRAPD